MSFDKRDHYPSHEITVLVNSRDRTSGTNTDFSVNFGNVEGLQEGDSAIYLREAHFPNTFYNVLNDENELKIFSPASRVITIPPGRYTASSLADVIEQEFANDGVTVDLTIDNVTNQYQMTWTPDGNAYGFDTGSTSSDRIKHLMGLGSSLPGFFISDTGLLDWSTNGNTAMIEFDAPDLIKIYSDIAQADSVETHTPAEESKVGVPGSASNTRLIETCPVLVPFGALNSCKWQTKETQGTIYPASRGRTTFNFRLRDKHNRKVFLPDNAEVVLEFRMQLNRS